MFNKTWDTILVGFLFVLLLIPRVRVQQTQPANKNWWKDTIYYRVLVDSFKDTDGDGIGDLQGLTRNMGYIRSLGAQAVVLSSITARSKDCTKPGSLSIDPAQLDARYGTDQQFTALLNQVDKQELKLMVTLPLEKTSELSEWTVLSANRSAGYEEHVVWREAPPEEPPSEIETETGSVQWKWNEVRGAYFATDSSGEVLLNACSPAMRSASAAALVAWLRRGVAGVLLQPDFPLQPECGRALVRELSRTTAEYARTRSIPIPILMVETCLSWRQAAQYYSAEPRGLGAEGADLVLYRDVVDAGDENIPRTLPDLKLMLDRWTTYVPLDMTPIWMSGSPQSNRIASTYGSGMVDAFNILNLMLPGAVLCYQGDELGVPNAVLERADSGACPPARPHLGSTPFPWDDSESAGFTTGTPWLLLADNHQYCNAKTQFASNTSHASVFRAAADTRRLWAGAETEVRVIGSETIGLLRWGTAAGSVLAAVNVGAAVGEASLNRFPGVPAEFVVILTSAGSAMNVGDRVISSKPFRLAAGEALLLAGGARHCGGPGPVEKIASKLSEAAQKINKYFNF